VEEIKEIKYLLWDIDGTLLDFNFAEKEAIRTCFQDFKLGDCNNQLFRNSMKHIKFI